jgi:hypothetical protein
MNRSPLQDAIAEVLRQGESLLNSLSDREYTRKLPNVFGSTVARHYRHCLDHFQSLLQGLDAIRSITIIGSEIRESKATAILLYLKLCESCAASHRSRRHISIARSKCEAK